MSGRERPLSPHLGVYRFRSTMALSILHRITGVGLGLGLLLLAAWLAAAAAGPRAFAAAQGFAASPVGLLLLLGLTFSAAYHACNGVRHLLWDLGIGLDLRAARSSGRLVAAAAVVLTAAVFAAGAALGTGG